MRAKLNNNYRLSPSKLNLFKECSRCFWLVENKNVRRPSGAFPSLPRGMDSVLKDYFDDYRLDGVLPPEIESLKDTKLFSNRDKLDLWRNNWKGISFTNKEGHILRGAIDELLVINNKLCVLDFKTRSSPPKPETIEFYRQQMNAYALLFDKNGFEITKYFYLLFYWPKRVNKDGLFEFKTELVKLSVDPKKSLDLFNEAINCLQGSIPETRCPHCINKEVS